MECIICNLDNKGSRARAVAPQPPNHRSTTESKQLRKTRGHPGTRLKVGHLARSQSLAESEPRIWQLRLGKWQLRPQAKQPTYAGTGVEAGMPSKTNSSASAWVGRNTAIYPADFSIVKTLSGTIAGPASRKHGHTTIRVLQPWPAHLLKVNSE